MFLIGKITRDHFESAFFDNSNHNPMNECFVTENVNKSFLMKAREDEDYQVINLTKLEYFDPKKNAWVKLKTK